MPGINEMGVQDLMRRASQGDPDAVQMLQDLGYPLPPGVGGMQQPGGMAPGGMAPPGGGGMPPGGMGGGGLPGGQQIPPGLMQMLAQKLRGG